MAFSNIPRVGQDSLENGPGLQKIQKVRELPSYHSPLGLFSSSAGLTGCGGWLRPLEKPMGVHHYELSVFFHHLTQRWAANILTSYFIFSPYSDVVYFVYGIALCQKICLLLHNRYCESGVKLLKGPVLSLAEEIQVVGFPDGGYFFCVFFLLTLFLGTMCWKLRKLYFPCGKPSPWFFKKNFMDMATLLQNNTPCSLGHPSLELSKNIYIFLNCSMGSRCDF